MIVVLALYGFWALVIVLKLNCRQYASHPALFLVENNWHQSSLSSLLHIRLNCLHTWLYCSFRTFSRLILPFKMVKIEFSV